MTDSPPATLTDDEVRISRKDERRGWAIAIVVFFATLAIITSMYVALSTHSISEQNNSLLRQHSIEVAEIDHELHILVEFQSEATMNHTGTYALLVNICNATPGCVVPKP